MRISNRTTAQGPEGQAFVDPVPHRVQHHFIIAPGVDRLHEQAGAIDELHQLLPGDRHVGDRRRFRQSRPQP